MDKSVVDLLLASTVLRNAIDIDGLAIGKLFRQTGLADLGVDWSRGVRGWIVAELDDEIIGAIQAVPSKPYGFIGDTLVTPQMQGRDLHGHGRLGRRPGTIGFALFVAALDYLKNAGCQFALGVTDKPGLTKIIKHYGGVDLGQHTLLGRNLATWRVRTERVDEVST